MSWLFSVVSFEKPSPCPPVVRTTCSQLFSRYLWTFAGWDVSGHLGGRRRGGLTGDDVVNYWASAWRFRAEMVNAG